MCFTLLENRIAQPGNREVFLVIENPDGTVSANFTDNFSGKFTIDGSEKIYSVRTVVNFNRRSQEVCLNYSPSKENAFQKGVQYVFVYSEGNLIGQGNFTLK